jgi:ribosomal protein RSM22 (predicted rRNA methylase)
VHHWKPRELTTLRRLRDGFLANTAGTTDYWRTADDLALYNETFGERIGWKWDAVLSELVARAWAPTATRILDFGCGSGIASRRVLEAFPGFTELHLHDRSRAAIRFAANRATTDFPTLRVTTNEPTTDANTLLVVSHVLNELTTADATALLRLARTAGEILWVEAGTHADSRALVEQVREPLRATHRVLAPCTHSEVCGLRTPANATHWCHTFAKAPSDIFQNAAWSELSRELGIDLRALPYSFLALTRHTTPPTDATLARVIGRPRQYKGYAKVLRCDATGVADIPIQKRDDKTLWNFLRDLPPSPLFHPPD